MQKVKKQMSEQDRKNLELMYRDLVFLTLAFFTAAITCLIMAVVINIQVPTTLGVLGSWILALVGWGLFLCCPLFLFGKIRRIRETLGMHKTAEKYGLG